MRVTRHFLAKLLKYTLRDEHNVKSSQLMIKRIFPKGNYPDFRSVRKLRSGHFPKMG